jgi:hypothetical protein
MPRPRLALRSPTGELLRNASGEVFAVEAPGIHLIQQAAPLRTNNSSEATPYGFTSDVRAGSLLTLQIANYLTGIDSITDTRGNTWQRAATNGDDSNFAEIWYAENAAPGPTTLTIRPVGHPAGMGRRGVVRCARRDRREQRPADQHQRPDHRH